MPHWGKKVCQLQCNKTEQISNKNVLNPSSSHIRKLNEENDKCSRYYSFPTGNMHRKRLENKVKIDKMNTYDKQSHIDSLKHEIIRCEEENDR